MLRGLLVIISIKNALPPFAEITFCDMIHLEDSKE